MHKKGFTLVEFIVAIVVLGMILTMMYRIFFYQEASLRRQRQWSEINIKPRKLDAYISKELRNIGFSDKTSSGGVGQAFGIISGTANSIEYSHDIYGCQSGIVDLPADEHSIRVSNDTLYIDDDFAIDNVISLEFTYIDTASDTVYNVAEVNNQGAWILAAGEHPVEHIEYNVVITSPFGMDTVNYRGLVSLRNKRP